MGLSRTGTFYQFGALPWDIVANGLIVGSATTIGSWFSKYLLQDMEARHFRFVMDIVLIGAAAVILGGSFPEHLASMAHQSLAFVHALRIDYQGL